MSEIMYALHVEADVLLEQYVEAVDDYHVALDRYHTALRRKQQIEERYGVVSSAVSIYGGQLDSLIYRVSRRQEARQAPDDSGEEPIDDPSF